MNTLPHIDIARHCDDWPGEAELLALAKRSIDACASEANLVWPQEAELSLVFTNDEEISKLNARWRNKAKPTNVLSFPGADIEPGQISNIMIGDIIFAFETIQRESNEQGKAFSDHLTHLLSHGFLHLYGYDHIENEQAQIMEALEQTILKSLNIADPYESTSIADIS